MMLKNSIILLLLAVAVSCDKITDKFRTVGSYERADNTSKTWFLSTWNSTWITAAEECKLYGMKLTTFDSKTEEAEELLKLYSGSITHPHAFIGYTDEKQEGKFTSLEGEKLQIDLNFHTYEPNNGRGQEHCLEVYILNKVVKYNDIKCSTNQSFICERESFIKIGRYEKTDNTSKTWFLSTWNLSWSEAVKECKSYGMELTTFGSNKKEADELLRLYSALNTHPDTFIGYTDEEQEGTFITVDGQKLQCGLNFHPNEPNNGGVGVEENCLEIYNFNNTIKYNDVQCIMNRLFICEFENYCQFSCDRVNEDNTRLQNELSEAKLILKRKESSLNEANLSLQRKDSSLSEANLSLQRKESSLSEANLNLQRKESLLSEANSSLKRKESSLNEANLSLQRKESSLSEANLNLQRKESLLSEANSSLQRKDNLLESQKSKHEEQVRLLQNELSEANKNKCMY